MDTRIYVMTHKEIDEIVDEMYIPLHVGRASGKTFGYAGDDTGDHISEKNPYYCELTGMYWLWKNVRCDIVGICHYRRYFVREEKLLNRAYIENKISEYPIIVPNSSCVKDTDVREHYAKRHFEKDLDLCREVIAEKYPGYLSAFDFAMQTILVSVGNMWITRKEIFDRYCTWLFDILFEVEHKIDLADYDDYQKRAMGFLAERLFRVWLFMQPEPVTEEAMKLIEPSEFLNAEKRVDLIYRCVKLKIEPLLRLYRTGAMQGTLAQPLDCADDFEGKMPVWVCWWQGEGDMPELIWRCIRSIKEHLTEETVAFRLITLENCMGYVSFTETVIRKFQEGKISYTHLSDLLRAELLYRYGGMWIDATYFITGTLKACLTEGSIYTLRFPAPVWSADITKGRWTGNFWCAPKGKKLFQFLMEGLWYYWEMEDEMIDYYLIDYVIAAAFEEFPEVKEELEQCPFCYENVFALHTWMNCKYSPERIQKMQTESYIYKLNWHADYQKENMAGEQTIYGYLCEQ